MKKSQFIGAVILTVMLFLSACASAASNDPFPVGTYAPPVQRTAGIQMVFSADGTYVMSGPQYIPVKGTYVLDQNKIVVTDSDGLCKDVPGTYTWTFDGKTLTLKVVEDSCSIRRVDWQAGPWAKQP